MMTIDRTNSGTGIDTLAERILSAAETRRPIAPITDEIPDFGLQDAYRAAMAVTRQRIARGERPIGWKIGFTNRTIWDEYGVHAPIWGPVYDRTVAPVLPGTDAPCPIGHLVEPRIEPEIVFRLSRRPEPGMNEAQLLGCIDAIAHGFEIVQSIFPGWRFRAADTVAAFALHGSLRHGPFLPVDSRLSPGEWLSALRNFTITLARDGVEMDRGRAEFVLGGPLAALRHFVDGAAAMTDDWRPDAGEIVTTGTLTRAFPIEVEERWTTRIDGLPVPGMDLTFSS